MKLRVNRSLARLRAVLLLLPLLAVLVSTTEPALFYDPPPAQRFELVAVLRERALPEISGLAASRRHPDVLWAINDSGDGARLYALDGAGRLLATVSVTGASNLDWEDLAIYEQDGESFLTIADIGDNFALRPRLTLYTVPEPALDAKRTAPARALHFRWEDGPRDSEALAVDPAAREFLLLEKLGGQPVRGLYALPMDAPGEGVARRVAELPKRWPVALPPGEEPQARLRGLPTAMDLSADGRRLLLLTYIDLALFEREPGEGWQQVLERTPRSERLPRLPLFESVALAPDGRSAWLVPEGDTVPLYRWRPAGSE